MDNETQTLNTVQGSKLVKFFPRNRISSIKTNQTQ